MRKLLLAAFLALLGGAAIAQVVTTWPPPAGTIAALCVYNASPAGATSGSPYYLQCDTNGKLLVDLGGSASGTLNTNIVQYNSIAVPANGLPIQIVGTAALATGQVTATSTVGLIVAARTGVVGTGRKSVCITNVTGTQPVYIGPTGITTSTGQYISASPGASICLDTQAAIYAIVSATPQGISYTETY